MQVVTNAKEIPNCKRSLSTTLKFISTDPDNICSTCVENTYDETLEMLLLLLSLLSSTYTRHKVLI